MALRHSTSRSAQAILLNDRTWESGSESVRLTAADGLPGSCSAMMVAASAGVRPDKSKGC